jgi:hypothetical protein
MLPTCCFGLPEAEVLASRATPAHGPVNERLVVYAKAVQMSAATGGLVRPQRYCDTDAATMISASAGKFTGWSSIVTTILSQ